MGMGKASRILHLLCQAQSVEQRFYLKEIILSSLFGNQESVT